MISSGSRPLPSVDESLRGWPWEPPALGDRDAGGEARVPRITIVTPSYNQSAYVEACLRSVLLQSYPELEYIVMDGGSTDGSWEVIRKYESYLSHCRSGPDAGQSDAIRSGFELGSGEVLGWVNSDDMLLPGALDAVGRFFGRHGEAEAVVGGTLVVDGRGRVVRNALGLPRIVRGQQESFRTLLHRRGLSFYQVASFWRSDAYEAVGGLDASLEFAMDYDLFLRLACRRPLRSVDRLLGAYRIHGRSKSALLQPVYEREVARIYSMNGGGDRSMILSNLIRGARWLRTTLGNLPIRLATATGRFELPLPVASWDTP